MWYLARALLSTDIFNQKIVHSVWQVDLADLPSVECEDQMKVTPSLSAFK